MIPKPLITFRYFARFKTGYGHIRLCIFWSGTRKYVVTPIVISREQLEQLDSIGMLEGYTPSRFKNVNRELQNYTNVARSVMDYYIARRELDKKTSKQIARKINREFKKLSDKTESK